VNKGVIAIIGDFETGTAEYTFFESFKTNFVLDVVPSEYRSQVEYFNSEEDALNAS